MSDLKLSTFRDQSSSVPKVHKKPKRKSESKSKDKSKKGKKKKSSSGKKKKSSRKSRKSKSERSKELSEDDETPSSDSDAGTSTIKFKTGSHVMLNSDRWGRRSGRKQQWKWKMEKQLGKGSFGKVYRVRRGKGEKTKAVAMKVESADKDSLVQEATMLRRIKDAKKDSFVISYLDHGQAIDDNGMECNYMLVKILDPKCATLHDMLKKESSHKVRVTRACKIAIQMLLGLFDIHSVGILHRDLKVENVGFLAPPDNDVVVLMDLGLARFFTDKEGNLRRPRSFPRAVGTEVLMSRHVQSGREYGRVDDLWSWFYTVLEMIGGENTLPWSNAPSEKLETMLVLKSKRMPARYLLRHCPDEFYAINFHLSILQVNDCPDYQFLLDRLASVLHKARRPKASDTSD